MRLLIILLCSLFLCVSDAQALEAAPKTRTSSAVKKERQAATKRVRQTQQKIAANKKAVGQKLNQLMSVQTQMDETGKKINGLRVQIRRIENNIGVVTDSIYRLQHDVEVLKQGSAKALRDSRKRRQSMSALSMVLSSKSFNEAMRRGAYLQELERSRAKSTMRLQHNVTELAAKKVRLDSLRSQQASAMKSLETQQSTLKTQQEEVQALVAQLKKQGSTLEQELKERNQSLQRLNAELEKAIAEEQRIAEEEERRRIEAEQKRIAAEREAQRKAEEERQLALKAEQQRKAEIEAQQAKAREEADKKAESDKKNKKDKDKKTRDKKQDSKQKDKKQKTTPAVPTPAKNDNAPMKEPDRTAASAPASTFAQSKGRLLFPVSGQYSIVGQFGRNHYADLSKVEVDNPGIDILTVPGSSARAVYPGTVSSIFNIDGYHHIVMVRHGEYLTIYANIERLSVRKGESVKAGQQLGVIYSDPGEDNRTVLHFEVRKERQKLNPIEWLQR